MAQLDGLVVVNIDNADKDAWRAVRRLSVRFGEACHEVGIARDAIRVAVEHDSQGVGPPVALDDLAAHVDHGRAAERVVIVSEQFGNYVPGVMLGRGGAHAVRPVLGLRLRDEVRPVSAPLAVRWLQRRWRDGRVGAWGGGGLGEVDRGPADDADIRRVERPLAQYRLAVHLDEAAAAGGGGRV